MHFPPGGVVGRQETAEDQLFAIVAGTGWVSGGDGRRRRLHHGWAALWAAGEEHAAGTATGMTAVCLEGDLEILASAVTREIVVADYDTEWPRWFDRAHAHIWPAVADVAVRIDNVGSTSVPGLAAKPIIDMDIVVSTEAAIPVAIERLAAIGYRWMGDFGVTGREAFSLAEGGDLPPHHLYLVVEDNRAHLDHWLLRDLLRSDPESRERYGATKRRNAETAEGDIDAYLAGKAELVAELLTRARAERGLVPVTYWRPDDEADEPQPEGAAADDGAGPDDGPGGSERPPGGAGPSSA
jgi:GrpB-like predicted nucleotidyltransferase (UPF0157 family)